jgi:hypothetical protein
MTINVRSIIGEFAVAADDGQRMFQKMTTLLGSADVIELDFTGVRVIATPFFNAAIGRLLKDLPPEELHRKVTFSNLVPVGHDVLARVIENSKQYYSDPGAREALDRILADHTEEQ